MAVVQGAELAEVIVDAGESAKSLNRPGMARLLSLVDAGAVDTAIIAKLDSRLTRSVADPAELLKRFERRGVSLVSVAEFAGHSVSGGLSRSQYHGFGIPIGNGKLSGSGRGPPCTTSARMVNGWVRPFGYSVVSDGLHLESNPAEQGILSRILELRSAAFATR